VVTRTKPG
jgi:Protein kinase domain